MNISFHFYLRFSLYSIPERIVLTARQITIVKIAIAIFSAFSALYVCLKLDHWRQRVTVIEQQGNTYLTHIKNVNGQFKVIFNGFFASNATAEGTFVNGQLNGTGIITFPSGGIAEEEGEFAKGWLTEGKILYRDGKVEEGTFQKGLLHGQGQRTFPNGEVHEGVFINGKFMN